MSYNTSFYFQSNRQRSRTRSGDFDEGRPKLPPPEAFSTSALMGRLSALDEQISALLRGEGRAPSAVADQLAGVQSELVGLAVALKELAHLRAGQESIEQSLRDTQELLRSLAAGQAVLQVTTKRLAEQAVWSGQGPAPLLLTTKPPVPAVEPPEPLDPAQITIEPVRPRLHFGASQPPGPSSILQLDPES